MAKIDLKKGDKVYVIMNRDVDKSFFIAKGVFVQQCSWYGTLYDIRVYNNEKKKIHNYIYIPVYGKKREISLEKWKVVKADKNAENLIKKKIRYQLNKKRSDHVYTIKVYQKDVEKIEKKLQKIENFKLSKFCKI